MSQAERDSTEASNTTERQEDGRVFIVNPAYTGNSTLSDEADDRISQVIGFLEILGCNLSVTDGSCPDAVANAAWGAQALLHEARELHYVQDRRTNAEAEAIAKAAEKPKDPKEEALKTLKSYRRFRTGLAEMESETRAELRALNGKAKRATVKG